MYSIFAIKSENERLLLNGIANYTRFAGDFIDNPRSFKFCVQIPGLLKTMWENDKVLFFNESTDNSIMESHASWILFGQVFETCNWNILFKSNPN